MTATGTGMSESGPKKRPKRQNQTIQSILSNEKAGFAIVRTSVPQGERG